MNSLFRQSAAAIVAVFIMTATFVPVVTVPQASAVSLLAAPAMA